MKIAYFDCFAGASGDMILGALLDAGLTIDRLREEIAKLHLSHYELDVEKVVKRGVGGSQARGLDRTRSLGKRSGSGRSSILARRRQRGRASRVTSTRCLSSRSGWQTAGH